MLPPAAVPNLPEAYGRLERRFHDICVLADTLRLLRWDQATMMPPQGAAARSEQVARIEAMRHEQLTAPELSGLLEEAEASASVLDPWQRANLREMRRLAIQAAAVPMLPAWITSRCCPA